MPPGGEGSPLKSEGSRQKHGRALFALLAGFSTLGFGGL